MNTVNLAAIGEKLGAEVRLRRLAELAPPEAIARPDREVVVTSPR